MSIVEPLISKILKADQSLCQDVLVVDHSVKTSLLHVLALLIAKKTPVVRMSICRPAIRSRDWHMLALFVATTNTLVSLRLHCENKVHSDTLEVFMSSLRVNKSLTHLLMPDVHARDSSSRVVTMMRRVMNEDRERAKTFHWEFSLLHYTAKDLITHH